MIEKVIMDMFKGFRHVEYDLGERTYIYGRNGSGKTTILDAIMYVLVDKDYSMKSNPEIHPDYAEESEPSVTLIWNADGTKVELRKYQKDVRTKKQIDEGAPIRIANQYEINSVPKSQKDFTAYLEDTLHIDVKNILRYIHPEFFTNEKTADCRKSLFDMVTDLTDKEIVALMPECAELAAELETYTVEEVTAKAKRDQKKAHEAIEAIPNQVIGLERAKVSEDTSEMQKQRDAIQGEIDKMEKAIMDLRVPSMGELNQQLVLLEQQEKQMIANANADRVAKLAEMNREIGDIRIEEGSANATLNLLANDVSNMLKKKNELEEKYLSLSKMYQTYKDSEFDPASQKCPYCGQDLPVHEIDKMSKKFYEDKKQKMDDVNHQARDIKNTYNKLTAEIKKGEEKVKKIKARMDGLGRLAEEKSQERAKYEKVITVTGTPEYSKLLSEIEGVRHKITQRDSIAAKEQEMVNAVKAKKQNLREIDDQIAQVKVNDRIDSQIAELKQQQREYSQAEANAERILDQLQALSMKKNSLMEEQVNSHFSRVKFRLFYTQKNGEIRDDCTPMVLANGEYRDITFSANTAAIVLAQLDIVKGLQEFYGQHLPVLLDGAECLDEQSLSEIDLPTQLIATFVTNGDLEVKRWGMK